MVYANNDEAFDLRFRNTAWKLSTGDVPTAELLFDGKPHEIEVDVLDPQVVAVHGGAEEGGYQRKFEESAELVLRINGEQITVDLAGSSAAVSKLSDCLNPS